MKAKPNGCIQLDLESGRRYLDTLELRSLPDLGYSSAKKLASLGITTIPELRALRFSQELSRTFGREEIEKLISFANGLDSRVLKLFSPRQSLSAEISWGKFYLIEIHLGQLYRRCSFSERGRCHFVPAAIGY